MKTIVQRAAHLKRLQIDFQSLPVLDGWQTIDLNDHADSYLTPGDDPSRMVTFPQCTWLKIDFMKIQIDDEKEELLCLLPMFLRHFPALERLIMMGDCSPMLRYLSAPEKLIKLELHMNGNIYGSDEEDETVAIDLSGLQTLILLKSGVFMEEDEDEGPHTENLNKFTNLSQVRLVASIQSAHIQVLQFEYLTDWTVALLSCPAVAGSVHSLRFMGLTIGDAALEGYFQRIKDCLPGGHFPKLTRLFISKTTSERATCSFLRVTPALEELSVVFHLIGDDVPDRELCDVQHPLPSLRRLAVSKHARPEWVESVRRQATSDLEVRERSMEGYVILEPSLNAVID